MRYLLDTQILLWAARDSDRLTARARQIIEAEENALVFSAASLWEIAIKASLRRPDFIVDIGDLRDGLVDNGYEHLAITAEHALALADLPAMHKDPFDRMLLSQAIVFSLSLVTADEVLGRYEGPIVKV